ncbi:Hypothetical predicted protein, partial [Podarcis lilfordi]
TWFLPRAPPDAVTWRRPGPERETVRGARERAGRDHSSRAGRGARWEGGGAAEETGRKR